MEYRWKSQGTAKTMQEVLGYIMKERKLDKEEMIKFVTNTQEYHDPFLFKDMKKVVNRIKLAKDNNEKICIIGDYDCDGVTSTSVMYLGLKGYGCNVIYKLPHRVHNGYGLKKELVDHAHQNGCSLIITVDNGIAAAEAVAYAKDLKIDVLITDHHEPQEVIPDCPIIDAKLDTNYPFSDLCGCAVAFKVIQALMSTTSGFDQDLYDQCLELVTIGTIADVVTLVDENRTFVTEGLKKIENTKNIGLKQLLTELKLIGKELESDNIGFSIGPCVNAAGRIDSPDIAIDLFLCDDEVTGSKLAKQLVKLNNKRKDLQNSVVKNLEVNEEDNCVVQIIEQKNAGISGIIASKIVDKYLRPCFVFADNTKETIHGSGRTFSDFSIIDCVVKYPEVVEGGGGHAGACGVVLRKDKVDLFKKVCNEEYSKWLQENPESINPIINATCSLDFSLANMRLINNINKLKPFGSGNPQPLFMTENVNVDSTRIVGKNENVIQFVFNQGYQTIKAVAFEKVKNKYAELGNPSKINILYKIGVNEWPTGIFNVQLNIEDISVGQ